MGWNTAPVEATYQGRADGHGRRRRVDGRRGSAPQELLTRSSRLVPLEEGTLQGTGRVVSTGDGAAVGYGLGGAEAYAARQHEDLSLHHDNGRQGKYLEQPHRQMANDGTYLRILGRAAERGMTMTAPADYLAQSDYESALILGVCEHLAAASPGVDVRRLTRVGAAGRRLASLTHPIASLWSTPTVMRGRTHLRRWVRCSCSCVSGRAEMNRWTARPCQGRRSLCSTGRST